MAERDLSSELHVDEVVPAELHQILLHHYHGASGSGPLEVTYPGVHNDGDQYAVKLTYNRDSCLVAATSGPRLTEDDLATLRKRVEVELLQDHGVVIGRSILFAALPVTGFFRFADVFQIVPVPPDAPRPPFMMAEHPFLLEFGYRGSPNFMVSASRMREQCRMLELLLGVLVEFSPHRLGDGSTRSHWVRLDCGHDEAVIRQGAYAIWEREGRPEGRANEHWIQAEREFFTQPRVAYLQEAYWFGQVFLGSAFSSVEGIEPMKEAPPGEYFLPLGIRFDRTLQMPQQMDGLLTAFFALAYEQQRQFLRACYWFCQSRRAGSRSAAFTALISAVEALMGPSQGGPKCTSCNRSNGKGPTARFVDFVEEHVPLFDKKARQRFYGIRSALSHGGDLLPSDEVEMAEFGPDQWQEWHDMQGVRGVAQVVLVNWLVRAGIGADAPEHSSDADASAQGGNRE